MKLGIMSDCHLGERRFRKQINQQNMFKLQNYKCFEEGLEIIKTTDYGVIPGDLFDSPDPSVDAIIEAKKLFNVGVHIDVIGGNHDFSKLAESNGYHCFDALRDGEKNVSFITEYKMVPLDKKTDLFMLSYGKMTPENFAKIEMSRNSQKNNILMIHGYLNTGNSSDADELYELPKSVAKHFNLVICGHIHLPNLVGQSLKGTRILTAGSIMPSTAAFGIGENAKPSVWIYDTETEKLDRIMLKSAPSVYTIHTDKINDALDGISTKNEQPLPIYSIYYNGSITDVDESIYKKALLNSMNLSIMTTELNNINQNIDFKVQDGFWDFVRNKHQEYYDEFQEIIKEAGV